MRDLIIQPVCPKFGMTRGKPRPNMSMELFFSDTVDATQVAPSAKCLISSVQQNSGANGSIFIASKDSNLRLTVQFDDAEQRVAATLSKEQFREETRLDPSYFAGLVAVRIICGNELWWEWVDAKYGDRLVDP